jgi:hypothetical protein
MRLASQTAEQQVPLFFRKSRAAGPPRAVAEPRAPQEASSRLAYAGVFLFTFVLYFRPNELLPGVFGTLPIAKTIAIITLIVYLGSSLSKAGPLTILPIETKMVALIAGLGVLFLPIAVVPQHTIDTLTEVFLKVGVIYVLMTNVVDTRRRLDLMWKLVVIAGTYLAYGAIRTYGAGQFTLTVRGVGVRIEGIVGGIFGNPNDLATALDMLLPLAVALAITQRGFQRALYWVCAVALAAGVLVTFSRGGFLGLVAMGAVLLWKLGRVLTYRRRQKKEATT